MVRITKYEIKLVKEKSGNYNINKNVSSPFAAKEAINTILDLNNEHVEKFGILALDTKNNIIGVHIIFIGTINECPVYTREIIKATILNNANSIILFHNHPSGDCTPSNNDIKTTKTIIDAGKIMGVNVHDHIIVGDDNFYSMKENGIF